MKLKYIARALIISFVVFFIVEFVPFQSFCKGSICDSVVGAKYEVISVDGAPPERMRHGFIITVVPLVVVKSGVHEVELKKEDRASDPKGTPETFLIKTEIESGEKYRIIEVDGEPQIIKEKGANPEVINRAQPR